MLKKCTIFFSFALIFSCHYPIEIDRRPQPVPTEPNPFTLESITGGTFTQGRSVTLSPYKMGTYEVTFDDYDAFCQDQGLVKPLDTFNWGRGQHPIINVSWFDAVSYCNWLSIKTGRLPVFTITNCERGDDGSIYAASVTIDLSKNGYRLPTEAEWEFAARGGDPVESFLYAGSSTIGDVAWYETNSTNQTHPVGEKQPNRLGLYDMSGNVWEWVLDVYGPYPLDPETNPLGQNGIGYRVLRGGSYDLDASYANLSYRFDNTAPGFSNRAVGFRIAINN